MPKKVDIPLKDVIIVEHKVTCLGEWKTVKSRQEVMVLRQECGCRSQEELQTSLFFPIKVDIPFKDVIITTCNKGNTNL